MPVRIQPSRYNNCQNASNQAPLVCRVATARRGYCRSCRWRSVCPATEVVEAKSINYMVRLCAYVHFGHRLGFIFASALVGPAHVCAVVVLWMWL